ncbi:4-demethylwyosine synthase TYW1 [Candidatus Pacearchaeota archaeon]|nr:4-demethylwyosine synthase TYW1 [Candidatus Pacearchaeota archaeon]
MTNLNTVNNKSQLTKGQIENLEKQQYRIVGNHSAVKICGWTKNMLRGIGGCYKYEFYGIRPHQCLQMTTSMFCASRCKFCWRGQKAPVSKEDWYGKVDNPREIISGAVKGHLSLLTGFGGNEDTTEKLNKEKEDIRHVALSLTGEPVTYPLINEILKEFHEKKVSTFIVTNAQYPEQIEKIEDVTQLYLSIDAPNKELMKKIDRPLFDDYWERMMKCLDLLKTRKYRTAIRLTLIKDENMCDLEGYASLINRGEPDFIELKSYMWVGESQRNYKVENMPFIEDVRDFSERILKLLPDYEIVSEHVGSRVVLLMKKNLNGKRWIDFAKFFSICEGGKDYRGVDYSSKVMESNC